MKNKELSLITLFIISSLWVYAYFPIENIFQQLSLVIVFFGLFPFLFNKFFLKKPLTFFGFKFGDWKQGVIWSFFSLIGVIFVLLVLIKFFNFFEKYTVPSFIVYDFWNFVFYEFCLVFLFVWIYEIYFRGFILATFEVRIGYWAILLQTIVFTFLVLNLGGASLYLFLPYLIFAPFAGLIYCKSRSILYSGVTQFLIIFILNVLIIGRVLGKI